MVSNVFHGIITGFIEKLDLLYRSNPYLVMDDNSIYGGEVINLFNRVEEEDGGLPYQSLAGVLDIEPTPYTSDYGYLMAYIFDLGVINSEKGEHIYFSISRGGGMEISIDNESRSMEGSKKVSCSISRDKKPSGGCNNSDSQFNTYTLGIRSFRTHDDGRTESIIDDEGNIITGKQLIVAVIDICRVMDIDTIYISDESQVPCKNNSISIENFLVYRLLLGKEPFYKLLSNSNYSHPEALTVIQSINEWIVANRDDVEFLNKYDNGNVEGMEDDAICNNVESIINRVIHDIGEDNINKLRLLYICTKPNEANIGGNSYSRKTISFNKIKRKYNKRKSNKRKSNKHKSNKRKSNKRKSNKRKSNKHRKTKRK